MKRGHAILLGGMLAFAGPAAGAAPAAKSDFRGLKTGMTVAEAKAAALANGMTCDTDFTGRTTCRGGDASVALVTTGRRGDHIWELQVSLAGHYDGAEMRKRLEEFYGLKVTSTPHVFDTAAGQQQLMLLEVGETSTIFYLMSDVVLHGDTEALPPPKL